MAKFTTLDSTDVPTLHGLDLVITHDLKEQATSEVFQVLWKQGIASVLRGVVHQYLSDLEVVEERASDEHPESCSMEEPHDHWAFRFRLVPKELLNEDS